jgi:hypothetical protein
MNTEGLFQAGDEVHHASTPNLIMVVVGVWHNSVQCSWLNPKTNENIEEEFPSILLRKVDKSPQVRIVTNRAFWSEF